MTAHDDQPTQSVQSAINRADSAAYDAQRDLDQAISDLHRIITRMTDAGDRLRSARVVLQQLEALAVEKGLDHEIPYRGDL
jgi:hypothetical protein